MHADMCSVAFESILVKVTLQSFFLLAVGMHRSGNISLPGRLVIYELATIENSASAKMHQG